MTNPLNKRVPRIIKSEWIKSLTLVIFLTLLISLTCGFLVGDENLYDNYINSFEKYNVENGHLITQTKIDKPTIRALSKKVKLEQNFFINAKLDEIIANSKTNGNNSIKANKKLGKRKTLAREIRIYENRNNINKVSVYKGNLPKEKQEIGIDRLFAEKNNIKIGNELKIKNKNYKVVGLVALSDYAALFKKNTDIMLNNMEFGVAVVSKDTFSSFDENDINYNYAWLSNKPSENKYNTVNKKEDEFIIKELTKSRVKIYDFVPRNNSPNITYPGIDMGADKGFVILFLYLVMVILAFIFGVTTKSKIEEESKVIGTLRASGYRKFELLSFYLKTPIIITFVGGILGNLLGYTYFYNVTIDMYLNNYSLTKHTAMFSKNVFFITTFIPVIIVMIINFVIISRALSLPIMNFLRSNLSKNDNKGAINLPNWKFMKKYRIRVLIQNRHNYLVLFIGIIFASILLLFSIGIMPVINNYVDEVSKTKLANYQYILKDMPDKKIDEAEEFTSLRLNIKEKETVNVYGVSKNSRFIKGIDLTSEKTYISLAYSEKYGIKIGDKVKLKNLYEDKEYKFKVDGIYKNQGQIAIFMNKNFLNKKIGVDKNYYNGYFSNIKLKNISEKYIGAVITEDTLTSVGRQMKESMGVVLWFMILISIIIYIIFIYLLSKVVIEKNKYSISILKILGYERSEISKIYNGATLLAVILASGISVPISYFVTKNLYQMSFSRINGWIPFYMNIYELIAVFVAGIGSYLLISKGLNRNIEKIDYVKTLKSQE